MFHGQESPTNSLADSACPGIGVGFGRVGEDGQSAVGGEVQDFPGEAEISDVRGVDVLDTGAVEADVVGGPANTEFLVAGTVRRSGRSGHGRTDGIRLLCVGA